MQNDDITWSIINKHHCSYKIKTDTQWFCRNEYNVTGLCNRKSCPLANSQYATVREEKGLVYLYVRRAENVYKPCQAWQKVKLSKTFVTALQQIEDTLVFWPNYFKQKCRQRLLKITQYLARMRKMKLHDTKKLVPVRRKEEKRLANREEKALVAAKLDNAIEKQLLERLKSGTYERIYNFPLKAFDVRLEEEEIETEDEFDIEEEELEEEEERERVQVKVEHGVNEDEEEMDVELREELERGVVREMRQEDSSEEEGEDEEDAESGEDDDTLALEDDSDAESNEEEDSQIEYVADFAESSDEEPEMDIEDLPQKLMPKARAMATASRKRQDDGNSSDPEEQDMIHRKKYDPEQPVRPSKKFALKKMQAKQKLRAIYEKEKMEKEKKKVRIGAGRR